MELLSRILAGIYFLLPVAAAAAAAWQGRKSVSGRATLGFTVTCFVGSVMGIIVTYFYAHALHGHAPATQMALAAYVTIGVMCLLKGANWLLREATERALFLRAPVASRNGWWVSRATFALTLRVVLLFGLGLPYITAVAMVYRPKVIGDDNPTKQFNLPYQQVRLNATDGVALDGWWLPAAKMKPAQRRTAGAHKPTPSISAAGESRWGKRTVILCHGLGADKDNELALVRDLVPEGFNVLAFDFRAHGSSGGQITSFGDLERRDVLGAVRWVRENQSAGSEQIFGLGISMGGAALIEAAADPSPEGRAIDALAVYDTFDDLSGLVSSIAQSYSLTPPLNWLATYVALPVASLHAGVNLGHFAPADDVDRIAPRPLLVIHGRDDEMIGFEHGVRLYERASQPKLRLWLGQADRTGHFPGRNGSPSDHSGVIYDNDAAKAVRLFFEHAEPML